MRASRASVIAGLALLVVAPVPVASAISAAATPVPSLGDLDDAVDDTVKKGHDKVKGVVEPILPTDPEPSEPIPVPTVPKPSEPVIVVPEPPTPKPPAPKPPTTTVPEPPTTTVPKPPTTTVPKPAPAPKPTPDKPAGSTGTSGGSTGGGAKSSGSGVGGGTGSAGGAGSAGSPWSGDGTRSIYPGPTLLGEPRGPEFASSGVSSSSIYYSGASPLLPEANTGDPNISSLLIAGGQDQAISPVADDSAGSVAGLLVLGTLASLMLFGCAAYLKYGKRRPAIGKHKA